MDRRRTHRRLRIMVADDDRDTVDTLACILRDEGHVVYTAYGGYEALAAVQMFRPDAVILDVDLPQLSGFDVVEQLRAHPKTQPLPIIVHTGMTLTDEERNRLADQLLTIVPKFNRESLFQHLASFYRNSREQRTMKMVA